MPPDASPTTATPPPAKPPRRRKAKRPAASPTAPKKPRATLRSRIEAMGPTHLAAYRTLCDGHPEFAGAVRDAFEADAAFARAEARYIAAQGVAATATVALRDAKYAVEASKAVLTKLDRLAHDIATARGDVPDADDAPVAEPATV